MKAIQLTRSELRLYLFFFGVSGCLSHPAHADEYYFDPSLFKGSSFGQNIDQFNRSDVPAGQYLVDVYLNNKLIVSSEEITFISSEADKRAEPCLSKSLIDTLHIKSALTSPLSRTCYPLASWTSFGNWEFDAAALRLNITLPMTALNRKPRGYVPVSEWDQGMTALFLRHNTNYTWTENSGADYRYQYLWSGITAGSNIANWQLRHQSNLRYLSSSTGGSSYRYNSVRTWVQRPLEKLNSLIAIGDSYTDSNLFGSLPFNGIKLTTDERMWPQGRRGYAPEIHGIASSNARVVVKQLNKVVYETVVPPGPFVIDDLFNTRSQGDFEVTVIEANGKMATFTVPYASVPDSVRPGNWHYSLAMGRVRQYYSVNNGFLEGVLQHGMSNSITATAGSRLAQGYQAWLLGGVWATQWGALGMNTTFSQAKVEENHPTSGWRAELSYSKTFHTGTNLVLAAYRYSTSGFRDLQDVLGVRRQAKNGIHYDSDTLNQRNRLSATLSQSLDAYGLLSLSASSSDYYNNQSRITQLQLGYTTSWKTISFGVNVARQRTYWNSGRHIISVNDNADASRQQKYTENTVSLNISLPLDWGSGLSSVAYNYNQSKTSRSSTVSLTGSAGEQRDLSYSMYGGTDRYHNDSTGEASSFGGNLQQNTRVGAFRASYGQGNDYRQLGLGTSGTLLLHRGGLTAGPYTSDTFALIHADGAQGAVVQNGQGAVIDSHGYALLPSLTPYRENTVTLDSKNMRADAELSGGSQRVVPYAGAVSQVKFSTLRGNAVLISLNEGITPPMGADVRDSEGTLIGVVGQGSQLYARVPHTSGSLKVSWNGNTNHCLVNYQIPGHVHQALIHLDGTCRKS
ncbi:outer membrane usher protein [Candidatus Pantoea floridensis]|uniref:Outer membrane usher protein n=1 Tax=Candidatus Pantoea floridensis TaxID=1938870 RepID=A0A286DP49_9GAMM|nr:outer membrane usher protein [Enterobacteriaceae bacterium JKS000233]SOD60314.1 outer membrane usher protein [Pantoea floridensis]